MQNISKARLKAEAVENGQWLIVAVVVVGVAIGLDILFGHSREPIPVLTIVVAALVLSSIVNAFLNLLFADLRERLYTATEAEQDA